MIAIANAKNVLLFSHTLFPLYLTGANPNGLGAPPVPDPSLQQQQQQLAASAAMLQQQQVGAVGAVATTAPLAGQQLMHPALAAINPAMQQAPPFQFSRPPSGAAAGQVAPMAQPFYFPGMQQFAAAGMGGMAPPPRPRSKGSKQGGGGGGSSDKKQCNCKNSRCLKLYCECFASGRYCDGCNCNNCCNNRTNEDKRQSAIEAILDRNPNAFRPKIADEADEGVLTTLPNARHNKGCNCKKSGCLKKYCECFQAGIVCSENCKCVDCKNFEGSSARAVIVAHEAKQKSANSLGLGGLGRSGIPGVGLGGLPGMRGPNVGVLPPGMIFPKVEPGASGSNVLPPGMLNPAAVAALGQGMNQTQRQLAAKDAIKEIVSPEVVDKMSMLLMILANEEADRRATAGETDEQVEPPAPAEDGSARRKTLYEEQERLVLTEFRDTLRTITRVVSDKVKKKVDSVAAKQQAVANVYAVQQAHAHQQALQQAHAAQMAAAAGGVGGVGGVAGTLQQPNVPPPYRGGPIPPGMQPVYLMQGGRPQLVLLPQQALMAQQLAQQQQLAAAAAAQQAAQQQQQQQVQVPLPVKQEGDTEMADADGNAAGS